ncbi:hypothetical protein Phum_PHUM604570 [Pediculus humanus corporis]|uniref:YLP motif-containing protein 1 n=1 Tax=Pediculus humanus subsp. corporis TaxID=121224 RepID=E0W3H0_PEDHC|nr:uncharacterized protein Phum_PHUM604570 [Pediculus humanus corporis]EEB20176.1 hypothetical protein Phum_PHUM604570 [Pediculus humanus corporis]
MQNQNIHSWSWNQGSGPGYSNVQPIVPTNFPPPGVEHNPILSGYQSMYGTTPGIPPPEYDQWNAAQLQQWQQWQQWQEKYQEWQAQYGKKYAESLAAVGQAPNVLMPGIPPVIGIPKPVDPVPAPIASLISNPPLPVNSQPVPPPPPDEEKPPLPFPGGAENSDLSKSLCQFGQESFEELSEAEKTFDIQFKQWEGQFNEWKKQNQDHPDKAQYIEYEKKWETWRAQLLQRREQMRKKRLSKPNELLKDLPLGGSSATATASLPKTTDSEYSYKTQSGSISQGFFTGEPPKFDNNKVPFFDKPPENLANSPAFNNYRSVSQSEKLSNQTSSYGNFEGEVREGGGGGGHLNDKFKGNNNFDAQRLGGNVDHSLSRSKFGIPPPQRFPAENFRRDLDTNQQRFLPESGRELFEGANRGLNILPDFRVCPPNMKHMQNIPTKPKVPSLFDITVEKPPGLTGTNNGRKQKTWDKDFTDSFEGRAEERDFERNDKMWPNANSNLWPKTSPSPWLQPWEIEKMASQKSLEREPSKDKSWVHNVTGSQELDKTELSGYVGNILAKLGNFNVMPPTLPRRDENQQFPSGDSTTQSDPLRRQNWNLETGQKNCEEKQNLSPKDPSLIQSGDRTVRNRNELEGSIGSRDLDERGNDFHDRLREGSYAPTNFDRLNEVKSNAADKTHFGNDRNDVDERMSGNYEDRLPFGRDDRGGGGGLFVSKDESRNFDRYAGKEDRRNFNNSDNNRFYSKDDRQYGRGSRDDRGFGRYKSREDVDERFGNRNFRRGFDKFYRDERDGRLFDRPADTFDRFGRTSREQGLSEPIWNPQVFDYSQGHGENKQAFDYDHGGTINDKLETRSFDYQHKGDTHTPTVIDYGHGVDKNVLLKDGKKDKLRCDGDFDVDDRMMKGGGGSGAGMNSPLRRRSRSPRGRVRSHSGSPHSRYKRGSDSPPFRGGLRSKSRDRLGRQIFKKEKNGLDDKLSPGDGEVSKHSFDVTTILVEDLICLPGRETRPSKLVFIMRGIPGSGKTYVTKLIKDKEIELGGDPPRILSLDDYFMTEVEKEIVDKETGRKIKTKVLEYEYEAGVEPHYRGSLLKAFKKTVSDGFFSFIIVDSVNEKTKDYEEMWSFAKQKGFQVYIAEMDNDVTVCKGRNIHKRTETEISDLAKAWEETPPHYLRLDVRSLLQSDAITEVEMEVVSDTELEKMDGEGGGEGKEGEGGGEGEKTAGGDEKNERKRKKNSNDGKNEDDKTEESEPTEEETKMKKKDDEDEDESGVSTFVKSRWDQLENSEQNLDRLDGLKRRREGFHVGTMEDYLQLPVDSDDENVVHSESGGPGGNKKRVRWADLEERRQQEKMRAIGFVVGQTDWSRMTDPTFGESALTRTKYI